MRNCATSQKVAGSISDVDFEEINGHIFAIFLDLNRDPTSFSETLALVYQITFYYTANIVSLL